MLTPSQWEVLWPELLVCICFDQQLTAQLFRQSYDGEFASAPFSLTMRFDEKLSHGQNSQQRKSEI